MPFTEQQEAFQQLFATRLREKCDQEGLLLKIDEEYKIAEKFVQILIHFKENLSCDTNLYHIHHGEINWTE